MWTIDELVERVREALAAEYSGAADGRVRDVPDRRAIRWYATIGLVDRPLGMRGRTALYGPRHLQQLVAIKRRQAAGRSLSQIQGELSWVSDEALAELSRVPERLLETDDLAPDNPANARHMRFWAQTPAEGRPPSFAAPPAPTQPPLTQPPFTQPPFTQPPITQPPFTQPPFTQPPFTQPPLTQPIAAYPPPGQPAAVGLASGETPFETAAAERTTAAWAGTTTAYDTNATSTAAATSVSGVALRGGAILLVPNPVSDRDRDDIAAAAGPLLDLLEARGLIDGRSK